MNRRELFREGVRQGGLFAVAGVLPETAAAERASPASGEIYRDIGVHPVINARGTFTIITGSQSLPAVKEAMEAASHSYVQMDELMEGVGAKLAALTGAPWGIVTGGCCAALTHCTTASVAGTNPERMQRLPDLTGMKNEVIIPEYSRNVYDHAIRMVGVKVVEVKDVSELEGAFNSRTAMAYILAGPGDDGQLGTKVIAEAAKRHGVPLVVDAAAEILTFPNVHLERGATAVAYSGGKCIRGPQAAGLLLGDKNLLQAAWANSAPHHAFGRSLKVGKEEIMGMLAAVEAWKTRDHDAEWKQWQAWLATIEASAKRVNGVTTRYEQPESLSNRAPILRMEWDANQVGITGTEVAKHLLDTEPRIVLGSGTGIRPGHMASQISVMPYMMMPGDDKIVAQRIYEALTKPGKFPDPLEPQGEPVSVAGQWQVQLQFKRGTAQHVVILEQHGVDLTGTHRGEFIAGDLSGQVTANEVRFRSSQRIEGQRLSYEFTGKLEQDQMSGDVDMGEYGLAQWTATRHQYQTPGGMVRPVKKS